MHTLLLLQIHDLLLVFLDCLHLEECQFNIRWMGTGWLGRWGHSRQELGSTWDLDGAVTLVLLAAVLLSMIGFALLKNIFFFLDQIPGYSTGSITNNEEVMAAIIQQRKW